MPCGLFLVCGKHEVGCVAVKAFSNYLRNLGVFSMEERVLLWSDDLAAETFHIAFATP